MTLTQRRIYYLSVILLFFVVAPLLAVYATGYRWDIQSGSFQPTGSLLIHSIPDDADVTVDGKNSQQRTPQTFNHIPPGRFAFSLHKIGFEPYTRTVSIRAKKSLLLENIILFSEQPPEDLKAFHQGIFVSPSERSMVLTTEKEQQTEISRITLPRLVRTGARVSSGTTIEGAGVQILDWSEDEDQVLISWQNSGQKKYGFVALDSPAALMPLEVPADTIRALIDPQNPTSVITENSTGTLTTVFLNGIPQTAFVETGSLVSVTADELFLLKDQALSILDRSTSEQTLLMPVENFPTVIPSTSDQTFAVMDPQHALTIVDRSNGNAVLTRERIDTPIQGARWWKDEKLLYWTDLEVWVWDHETRTATLVTRTSKSVLHASWHPKGTTIAAGFSHETRFYDLAGGLSPQQTGPTLPAYDPVLFDPQGRWFFGSRENTIFQKPLR